MSDTLIVKRYHIWRLHLEYWYSSPNGCSHGPQTWTRWRPVSLGKLINMVKANAYAGPSSARWHYRVWVYSRRWSLSIDLYWLKPVDPTATEGE